MSLGEDLERATQRFKEMDAFDLAARLTLMFLLIYRADQLVIQYSMIVFAVAGLALPGLHRSRYLWFAITAVMFFRIATVGMNLDNHGFLLLYWCLALSVALTQPEPRVVLATQARLLVGGCFFFAALWKGVLSPDFMSGDFFHLTYLNDERFISFTQLISGGLDQAALAENRALVKSLRDPNAESLSAVLASTSLVRVAAVASAWWTILLESFVALVFLLPARFVHARIRDGSLIVFAVTTYAIAPVMGFGWLLMLIGIAQTQPDAGDTRLAYLLTCFLVAGYKYIPWLDALARALA